MCRLTSLFVGVDWIQFGSNLGHLNIEFLVWSGLVQFILCSRRCLKRWAEFSSTTTAKTINEKKVGGFGTMTLCSISVHKISALYHVIIMCPTGQLWVAS